MLLTEIADHVMLESGEFIIGSMDLTLIDQTKFWNLVRRELAYYEKYKPLTRQTTITCDSTTYAFPTGSDPDWISSIVPVGIPTGMGMQNMIDSLVNSSDSIRNSRQFIWRYEKPKIFVSEAGKMDVTGIYKRVTEVLFDPNDNTVMTDVRIDDITESDSQFFNLVIGKFLIAVGRSRRAFTLQDMPIEMDASDLITEGQDIYQSAKESLQERSKWWEAVGV